MRHKALIRVLSGPLKTVVAIKYHYIYNGFIAIGSNADRVRCHGILKL